jgi:flagellar hook-length control protein FliK
LTQAVSQANTAAAREAATVPQQPLSMSQNGWSEAVVERVMWLSSQNLKSAEIQLDPADLGRLEVRISLNQEQTQVSFASPHAGVRDALEGQLQRLRDMFNQQGMNLVDVNVSDQSLARDDRQTDERSGSRGIAAGGEEHADVDDLTVATTALDSGRGLIDFYA